MTHSTFCAIRFHEAALRVNTLTMVLQQRRIVRERRARYWRLYQLVAGTRVH